MNRKFFVLLLCLLAFKVSAEPVTFDFNEVKIRDLLKVAYGEVLQRSYVIESGVLDDSKRVSMVLRNIDSRRVDQEIRRILESNGLSVEENNGVLSIQKRSNLETANVYVYAPRFRSANYLMDVAVSIFPRESFSQQRRIMGGFGMGGMGEAGQPQKNAPESFSGPSMGQNPMQQNREELDVIVFRGRPAEIARLKQLYEQLDVPSGQVMVRAALYEVQASKSEGSAVDLVVSFLKGKFGFSLAGGAGNMMPSINIKLEGDTSLTGVYAALATDERFKMVSSPRLRVKSGASSVFSVGTETPVLSSVSYDNLGRPIQSVNYKPSGVIFKVRPKVREETVDLYVSQQLSQFVTTTNGVNGTPTLISREITTEIAAGRDEVIVIGGLDETKTTENETGLTFLPSFMRSDTSEDVRTEIVLLLHVEKI